jgi:hypothetical protein
LGVTLARILAVGLVVGLIGLPVRSRDAVPKPDYRGTGVVVALLPPPSDLHATRPVIIIHHDVIQVSWRRGCPCRSLPPPLGLKVMPEGLWAVSLERLGGPSGRERVGTVHQST